jgi:hypothetical protein
MEPKRGLMIQAPMGTGKSFYVEQVNKSYIIDGDDLLKQMGIKNRNFYWYFDKFQKERNAIMDAFDTYLNNGYWILYSSSPKYLISDIIVLPDKKTRWNRLQQRDGVKPTKQQFDAEQKAYEESCHDAYYYISGKIPSLSLLTAMYEEILDKNY